MQEVRLARSLSFWAGKMEIPREVVREVCVGMMGLRKGVMRDLVDRQKSSVHVERWFSFSGGGENSGTGMGATIEALTTPRSQSQSQGQGRMRLIEALQRFSRNECSEIRDKVFGLRALVLPTQRVNVDYTFSIERVMDDVATILLMDMLEQESSREGVRTYHGTPSEAMAHYRADILVRAEQISKIMSQLRFSPLQQEKVSPSIHDNLHRQELVAIITWAHLVYNMSELFPRARSYMDLDILWTLLVEGAVTERQKAFARVLYDDYANRIWSGQTCTLRELCVRFIRLQQSGMSGEGGDVAAAAEKVSKEFHGLLLHETIMNEYRIEGVFLHHQEDWDYPARKRDRQDGNYW